LSGFSLARIYVSRAKGVARGSTLRRRDLHAARRLSLAKEEGVRDPKHTALSSVRLLAVGVVVLTATLAITPAAAQVLYGSIVGNVTDPQGGIVPGATVTIVSKDTNLTRETTTNEEGNYSLTNVLAGRYDVKISLQGFREVLRANVST
jgi:hypothetical protein